MNVFMRFLSVSCNMQVVDLRNRYEDVQALSPWTIIEPSTDVKFNTMRNQVPMHMAMCASNYLSFKSFEEGQQHISSLQQMVEGDSWIVSKDANDIWE